MSFDNEYEFRIVWKIENFNFLTPKRGEYIDSPDFKTDILDNISWYLRLYPRFTDRSMGCYLRRSANDNGPTEVDGELEIQIITAEGNILNSKSERGVFLKDGSRGWMDFLENSIILGNFQDFLTVRCNLKTNLLKKFLSKRLCVTHIGYDQHSITWIVKNLNSACSEIRKFSNSYNQVEISIQVLNDDIKIVIRKSGGAAELQSVVCQITLLDVKGQKHDSKQAFNLFEKNDPPAWNFPTFLKKSRLNSEKEKYLKNDCFALKFKIAVSNGTRSDSIKDKQFDRSNENLGSSDIDTVSVLEDMKRLHKDKVHADVKLLVNDQTILAHKNILSIRSPVFLAMFDTDMVENETGSVAISDFEVGTMNSLLEYMYTGTVEKLDCDVAAKLIVAADKYQVLFLKEKCANFLKSILSKENVCEVLLVSDLVQHEALKAAAVKYIKKNNERIFLSDEWNRLVETNLSLATKTVSQISVLLATGRK